MGLVTLVETLWILVATGGISLDWNSSSMTCGLRDKYGIDFLKMARAACSLRVAQKRGNTACLCRFRTYGT